MVHGFSREKERERGKDKEMRKKEKKRGGKRWPLGAFIKRSREGKGEEEERRGTRGKGMDLSLVYTHSPTRPLIHSLAHSLYLLPLNE